MAFDFKSVMGTPKNGERRIENAGYENGKAESGQIGGSTTKGIDAYESVRNGFSFTDYAQPGWGQSDGMEKTLLFGEDANHSPIPVHTSRMHPRTKERPVVIFQNPDGVRFGLTNNMLSRHLLLLGGIGSGKTNAFNFMIESIQESMTDNDIMFIFDTKGDFYRDFYEKDNPDHILIGNNPAFENETYYWNLFDELREPDGTFNKNSEITCKEVAKQLFEGRGSDTQPFFELAAADLVSKVLCHYIRSENSKFLRPIPLNNYQLVEDLRRAEAQQYDNVVSCHPDFRSARLYYGDPGKPMTPQALGVFGYINSMVNDLFVGIFAEKKGKGPFSMRKLVREKGRKIVFIEYDLSVGEVLAPIYRLLIDLALKEALGRSTKERGNVYFMIDEFKLLPNLMHIDDALNFGRSLGVKVCAGLQSINQLYDIYGEDRGKVLAAGFMNSFCFQTWDQESRKYISQRFGDNYANYTFRVQNNPVCIQREGQVVEDWDILNLNVGEAYINLTGEKPFKFQFSNFEEPHEILT